MASKSDEPDSFFTSRSPGGLPPGSLGSGSPPLFVDPAPTRPFVAEQKSCLGWAARRLPLGTWQRQRVGRKPGIRSRYFHEQNNSLKFGPGPPIIPTLAVSLIVNGILDPGGFML